MNRIKQIVNTSIIGIISNIFLVIMKVIIGIYTKSLAIIMDAINNLSDSLSSFVNIIIMHFAGKAPDKKHPYGHGKIEYISAIAIASIIFVTGVSSLYESTKKIINPSIPKYTTISLILIIIGIIVKYLLSIYYKKKGNSLNAGTLKAAGIDSFYDALLSLATLMSAIICIIFKINLDGPLGMLISIFIIKTAIDIFVENFDYIIGTRVDGKLTKNVKRKINNFEGVLGTYDLILHQYGPEKIFGSAHIEVNEKTTAKDIHTITRNITQSIYEDYGIIMTIGIYATNINDKKYIKLKNDCLKVTKTYSSLKQLHGFYIDNETHTISFDIIFDYEEENPETIQKEIIEKLTKQHPDYSFNIIIDYDISD